MTEFEIQRNLRAMNAPRMPERDLWPQIASRIASASAESAPAVATARRRRRWIPLAAAAGTVLAVAGSLFVFSMRKHEAATADDGYALATQVERVTPQQAREQALRTGEDPRIVGANIVIDSAQAELHQALEQHPGAVFLVSLLNRTNAQRMKLEQFGAKAG